MQFYTATEADPRGEGTGPCPQSSEFFLNTLFNEFLDVLGFDY